jgi:hypothetical protein
MRGEDGALSSLQGKKNGRGFAVGVEEDNAEAQRYAETRGKE